MKTNALYYGDNLEILRKDIDAESIDLCYIDPPFNSKRNYFQIYNRINEEEDRAQAQAFIDTWTWDAHSSEAYNQIITNFEGRFTRQTIELVKGLRSILDTGGLLAYLVSMTLRITEIYRVLKPTGSFYLHCDPTASHYLKLVLDAVFCSQGGDFQNEITWGYRTGGIGKSHFARKHDVILFYSKSNKHTFIPQQYKSYQMKQYKYSDKYPEYYDEEKKQWYHLSICRDIWDDIPAIGTDNKERQGYPTQKPKALLKRILSASSNEGDTVLDCYCGCGTTIAVAEELKRKWIGIDITYQSISLILKRLEENFGPKVLETIKIEGIPKDMESARALANRQDDPLRKEFEKWAVLTYTNNKAVINTKKGADKGVDGIVYFATVNNESERMIFQVKSGGANRATIATLHGDMISNQAKMGILITMDEPTKSMKEDAANAAIYHHPLMNRDYNSIQIVTIREIVEEHKRLEMPLVHDVLKTAKANTEGSQTGLEI
ncbi:MAG: DNA methyltransferase [Chloroflexi bacterium]|nr:DNA methyltransferase [Chloroflexota bacterium]